MRSKVRKQQSSLVNTRRYFTRAAVQEYLKKAAANKTDGEKQQESAGATKQQISYVDCCKESQRNLEIENKSQEPAMMTDRGSSSKVSSGGNSNDDNELQQLLTLSPNKLLKEERNNDSNKVNITAENFEKIIADFDGETVPVKSWFTNFEYNAEAYGLNSIQMYVQARNKMVKTANLFLEAETVNNYDDLKRIVIAEFDKAYDSSEVHKKLSSRKKQDGETFYEYTLNMKKIASRGNVEEKATIQYIVDGLKIKNELKQTLYAAKTMKELRENYEIVEKILFKQQNSESITGHKRFIKKKEHCFNCGSTDHRRTDCRNEPKCFRCNKYGHIAKSCILKKHSEEEPLKGNVRLLTDETRLKEITVGGVQLQCLVDTGSDITLIKQYLTKKINNAIIEQTAATLRGFGNCSIKSTKFVTAEIEIDEIKTTHKFLLVPNNSIEYDCLLGYDFIRKYKMTHVCERCGNGTAAVYL